MRRRHRSPHLGAERRHFGAGRLSAAACIGCASRHSSETMMLTVAIT